MYITPPISLIGIVGHTLMLLTLRYGQLSDSPYVYLKCIALGSFFYEVVSLCEDPVYCPACQYSVETFYNLYVYQWSVNEIRNQKIEIDQRWDSMPTVTEQGILDSDTSGT